MIATYEYQCDQCKSVFELRRDWNAKDTTASCPLCQRAEVHRLFTPVMMLSRSSDGATRAVSANSCGGCSATSCGSCGSAKN